MITSYKTIAVSALSLTFVAVQTACTSAETRSDTTQVAAPPATVTAATPVALLNPDSAALVAPAPDSFDVVFETSKGNFTIRARRAWSPHGVDRFHYLVANGFYDGARFFRVVPGFMVQFGLNGNPQVDSVFGDRSIPDDPVKQGNTKGRVSFAMRGRNTRTTQLFINYGDNSPLDKDGFSAIGEVVNGMNVVESITAQYQELPDQAMIRMRGNAYLQEQFPQLDYIKTATMQHHQ